MASPSLVPINGLSLPRRRARIKKLDADSRALAPYDSAYAFGRNLVFDVQQKDLRNHARLRYDAGPVGRYVADLASAFVALGYANTSGQRPASANRSTAFEHDAAPSDALDVTGVRYGPAVCEADRSGRMATAFDWFGWGFRNAHK